MSGFVGILNLDGSPVDRDLLWRMTEFMSSRGPDAQEIWTDGSIGFGHTMFRTTWEAETEKQPLSLDGQVWVTADARIDGRSDLIRKLEAKLRRRLHNSIGSNGHSSDSRAPNDAELVLYAYAAWGEDCVTHFIGDFAFAIWDQRTRTLFCARDHFGVKPFFYAHLNNTFVFSNTLDCVRLHPAASAKLNENTIGDYLLFGMNCEVATTVFADIARLPGAHALSISARGLRVRRYWSLPTDFHLNYKDSKDYPEQFRALLLQSVKDRLRTDRVAIEMSGGLDSTSVAAMAKKQMVNSTTDSIKAFCVGYDRLIPDREKVYANIAAKWLNIPITHVTGDDFNIFDGHIAGPEPHNVHPLSAVATDSLKRMAAHSRVTLTGWDGDTWISETPRHYFYFLLKQMELGRLSRAMSSYVGSQRKLPPLGVRTTLRRWFGKPPQVPAYPVWLEPAFERRTGLRERWELLTAQQSSPHPTRPSAFRVLSSPSWANLFEGYDAAQTGLQLEARHPMTDVRLGEFLLSVPPVPWCASKEIIRKAMREVLPPEILCRPKTPLQADPAVAMAGRVSLKRIDSYVESDLTGRYVRRDAVPAVAGERDTWRLWINVRPFSLNLWLKSHNLGAT